MPIDSLAFRCVLTYNISDGPYSSHLNLPSGWYLEFYFKKLGKDTGQNFK